VVGRTPVRHCDPTEQHMMAAATEAVCCSDRSRAVDRRQVTSPVVV
jgi:hypothetical protein